MKSARNGLGFLGHFCDQYARVRVMGR